MDKIFYDMTIVPAFNDPSKWREYLYVTLTIDNFLLYDPPCKECLIQATCLHNATAVNNEYIKYLYIEMCHELKIFVTYNKFLKKLKD